MLVGRCCIIGSDGSAELGEIQRIVQKHIEHSVQ